MRDFAVLFIALQKGQSNRRSHLPDYAAWEIHLYSQPWPAARRLQRLLRRLRHSRDGVE